MAKRPVPRYDFKAFGAAIKAAREGCKESRKKVGDEMFLTPALRTLRAWMAATFEPEAAVVPEPAGRT